MHDPEKRVPVFREDHAQSKNTAATSLPPVLNIIALATFAASLSTRALDPVLPHVASDFGVSIATAAGFAAVYAFTFAIVQPVLGAAADLFGKARLVIVCLVLLGLANILGASSSSFALLFASRILAGIGAGGVFPIALGLTSDLVGPKMRQVAIGRTLMGSMTGNLLGASLSGLIGDFLGWRGVLAVLGVLAVVASVAVALGFRGGALKRAPAKVDLSVLRHGYRTIFANPNARVCYAAVFIEGCCVLGLFPYVASFLFEQGVTSLSISGLVIAGFAVGGLFYTLSVSRLLPRLGVNVMMISGAVLMGLQLAIIAFGPRWQLQAVNFIFMGWGFYLLHGSLQVFASELSVEARATALSLHSFFFFMGQTVGPIAYGFGILNAGKIPAVLTSAVIIVALGFACAGLLRQSRPADVDARPDVQP
jgi:predicted MFS family arabinose efflux permease